MMSRPLKVVALSGGTWRLPADIEAELQARPPTENVQGERLLQLSI